MDESYDPERQGELAVPKPSPALLDVVRVHELCQRIEQQLPTVNDVEALHEAQARIEAIAAYVRTRSRSGLNQLATTRLKLVARVGEILNIAAGEGGIARDTLALSKNQRERSRRIAKHSETIDKVAAASTDEHPVSERKVLAAVATNSNAARLEQRWMDAVERYPFVAPAPEGFRKAVLESVVEIDRATTPAERQRRIDRLRAYIDRKLGTAAAPEPAAAPADPPPPTRDPAEAEAIAALHEIGDIARRLPALFAALDAWPAVNDMAGPWPAIAALRAASQRLP